MDLKPRDYQINVINKTIEAVEQGSKSILVVLPCRSGKTPLATYITKSINNQGGKVLFNVHRKILLKQTSNTFTKYGIPHGMLSPDYPQTTNNVQIGTIGTIHNRLKTLDYPNIIISDEAHRDKSTTREYILKYFPESIRIGLTATPIRLSGESLNDVYETMIVGPSVDYLINQGHLCEYNLFCPPSLLDTSSIKTLGGDFNNRELAKATNKKVITGDCIKHYKNLINGLQTCVFCCDINHAKDTAKAYNDSGISATYIHSGLSAIEQKNAIDDFVSKKVQVITNVDMITEGYDCPGIDAVQLLRKTMSLAMHIQMSTRCMTPAPGKKVCYILDHVGNTEEHGPVDSDFNWSLDCGKTKKTSLEQLQELQNNTPVLIKICSECWFTYAAYKQCCPCCGSINSRPPIKFKVTDETLLLTKTVNGAIRELVGKNETQGVSLKKIKERLELFKSYGIPEASKHFIKIQKRYDTMTAKTPEEINSVAIKWGYSQRWCFSRYMMINKYKF